MDPLFIARQPIYNRTMGVMGYELLYRDSDINQANIVDGASASCETILNSFMHIGIDNIVGSALAFVNLPREFIINESLTPMLKEQAVLEILEDVVPDEEVIKGLKRLKSNGFRIAMDDFEFQDKLIPMIELADYIKIDVYNLTSDQVIKQLELLKPYKAELIAEKVQTQELYKFCEQLDFTYFQGYFFCYPEMLQRKAIPANKAVILNLISKLQNPDIESEELENILIQDITLSYKLLRYINSAAFSLRREVDSIKDAIIVLGLNNLKKWLSLIMMSKIADNKPTELVVIGMIRGRMCELLAEKLHPEIKGQMFIIGLFSVLDAIMDQPLIDLLDTVILSTPIKMALLDKSGAQGELYQYVLDYEKSNWDELTSASIDTNTFIQSYIEAVYWADESIKALE